MNLKQIEIAGFKSFAKKSVLDFKTSITAIVGPNGSGKSNVAEAFSFVLGEQSIKSMRGKKGEDLIYNGSFSGNRSNRASVKVVFDNRKRFLDIDFDEVYIERVVHRDGNNDYSINNSQVRLKDVIELLSGANIGSTGHHIISQGESDRILNVNAKERKAIVEDALGLKIYQIRRKESEKKLEKTNENIGQIESLRREIKPHLKFLERQKDKIEKTLEMRKELVKMYKEYFKREDQYLKKQKIYIENETKIPKEKLKEIENEIINLEKGIKKEDLSEVSKKLGSLEEKIASIRVQKGKLILELGRYEGELKSLKRISLREGETKISISKVEKLIKEVEEKIDSYRDETDLSKIKTFFLELKESFKGFLLTLRGGNEDNMAGDIFTLESKLRETEQNINKLIEEEKTLKDEFEKLRRETEEDKDTMIESERRIFDLKTSKGDILLKLNSLEALKERVTMEEGEYKRELTEAAVLAGRESINFEDLSFEEEEREEQEKKRKEIEKIKIRLEDAGGASGEEIIREYEEVKERDDFLEREIDDLEKGRESLNTLIKELEEKLENEFSIGLNKINDQFQEFFSLMFGGGTASLSVVKGRKEEDEEEEILDGIEIEINLPKKKIKGLMMLSGGERALTSIALLFAMSQVNPPPFIILDETDAALDEANSKKYADMIKNLSEHSQLILITHNRETMSRAGVLYGVTMDSSGVSKLLSVDLEEAVEVAK